MSAEEIEGSAYFVPSSGQTVSGADVWLALAQHLHRSGYALVPLARLAKLEALERIDDD